MAQAQDGDELVGRELLLDVALRLFMEDGYDGVSMQQIASAAHMTKGSPYYHFKGKEDLFLHAFVTRVQRVNAGFLASQKAEGSLAEKLVAAFMYLLQTTDPGMIRMLDDYHRLFKGKCSLADLEFEPTPDVMRRAYLGLFGAATVPLRQSPEMLADALMAFQLGTVHMRVIQPDARDQEMTDNDARRIAEETIDLFLHGAIMTS